VRLWACVIVCPVDEESAVEVESTYVLELPSEIDTKSPLFIVAEHQVWEPDD
jgi:hypothetical protein